MPTVKPPQPSQPSQSLPTVKDNIGKEQPATARLTPYNQACEFLQQWKDWRSSRLSTLGLLGCLEKPLSMKINVKEWAKLYSDFNLGETDEA
jgi:hypothetical protein